MIRKDPPPRELTRSRRPIQRDLRLCSIRADAPTLDVTLRRRELEPRWQVVEMWNWILMIVIVGGLVALLTVAAVRQRRYAGDTPIAQQHKKNMGKGKGGGSQGSGGV